MIELRSKSKHSPRGMVVEVPEERVDELLKTGLYERVGEPLVKKPKKVKKEEVVSGFSDGSKG